jgi:hypothetical protein
MPDWGWDEWEALPRVGTPTLFVVGELEDPDDETAEGAALMPNASRFRVLGQATSVHSSDANLFSRKC